MESTVSTNMRSSTRRADRVEVGGVAFRRMEGGITQDIMRPSTWRISH